MILSMKKRRAFLVAFVMLISLTSYVVGSAKTTVGEMENGTVVENTEETIVSVDFGKKCKSDNAQVRSGDRGSVTVFEQDGEDCWKTDMESLAFYIYIDIDDKVLYNEMTALEVEIEYYDIAGAQFSLEYESQDAAYKKAGYVVTGGTKEWKKAEFYIDDTKLANGENGADMRITPFVDQKGRSAKGIAYKSIRIKKVKFRNPVKLSYEFERPGGIFVEDTGIGTLCFTNILKIPFNIVGKMDVYCNDEFMYTEPVLFNIEAEGTYELRKEFRLDKYGLYIGKLQIKDNKGYFDWIYDINFSKSILNTEKNPSFGTNGHYGQIKGSFDINAKLMNEMGNGWVRDGVNWDHVETEKGVYSYETGRAKAMDEGMEAYYENGLDVLLVLLGTNPIYDEGKTPASDEAIQAYTDFCVDSVKHYRGKINAVEIWNEYNLKGFNPSMEPPETYAKMLKSAYTAIKKIDPEITVVGCATSGVNVSFIQRVLEAGGAEYMDVISVHPYNRTTYDSDTVRGEIAKLREVMAKYGIEDMPIWSTEDGFAASPDHYELYGYTEKDIPINEAKFVLASGIYDLCDKLFMYDFQNDGTDPLSSEHNYGLIKSWSNKIDDAYAAKTPYITISFANYFVNNNTYIEKLRETQNERIFLYKDKNSDKNSIVMWNIGKQSRITLRLSEAIDVYDMYGNVNSLVSPDGIYTFETDENIIYITGNFSQPEIIENPYYIEDNHSKVARGEHFSARLLRGDARERKEFLIEDACGLVSDKKIVFEIGETEKIVDFDVPADSQLGEYKIKFTDSEKQVVPLTAFFEIIDPIIISGVNTRLFYKDRWDYWCVEFEITNKSSVTLNGSINFKDYVYAPKVAQKFYDLAPNETREMRIVLDPMQEKRIADVELCAVLNTGAVISKEAHLTFLTARRVTEQPQIDGVLSPGEWRSGAALFIDQPEMARLYTEYGGLSDLQGKAYLMWDDVNLYLGAEVYDDVFCQKDTGQYVWRGDQIQLALFDESMVGKYEGQQLEIGLSLTENGVEAYKFSSLGNEYGSTDAIEAAIRRDGKLTYYEAKIPWKEAFKDLVEIKEGKILKISMLINDNDGTGRRGWLEYGSGIGYSKDPSLFLDLNLAGE